MQSILARHTTKRGLRLFTTTRSAYQTIKEGLVIGAFSSPSNKLFGSEISDSLQTKIKTETLASGYKGKAGDVQLVFSDDLQQQVAVVGLGCKEQLGKETTEVVRTAVAHGIKKLKASNSALERIQVSPMPCAQAAAEGAHLATYSFKEFKTLGKDKDEKDLEIKYASESTEQWDAGKIYASAQNWARDLMNTPANTMTPSKFAETAQEQLWQLPGIKVHIRDADWAEQQRMGGLLAVSRGSDEPLRFLEITYNASGSSAVDLALVGKGITFDTGGYSLKPSKYMDLMKGDMGGGATVVAAMRAIAQLQLPLSMAVAVPLCENMINGRATKVSDVYTARSGLTVEVMNTDAEGRVVLADALHYVCEKYRPHNVLDVATLTGAMVVALGELYTGTFTPSSRLWERLENAARLSDEPVWRMPLHDRWDAMLESSVADLSNIGNRPEAGACTAAAFLRHFVHDPKQLGKPSAAIQRDQNQDEESRPRWAHLDIAGPMESVGSSGYHHKGMSGRPTRLLIELARQLSINPIN